MLIQEGTRGLGSTRFPVQVNFDMPTLHWILAIGYDDQGLLYQDTADNVFADTLGTNLPADEIGPMSPRIEILPTP